MDVEQNQLSSTELKRARNKLAQRERNKLAQRERNKLAQREYRARRKQQGGVPPSAERRGRPRKTDKAANSASLNQNADSNSEQPSASVPITLEEPNGVIGQSTRMYDQRADTSETKGQHDNPALDKPATPDETSNRDGSTQLPAQQNDTLNPTEAFIWDPPLFESREPAIGLAGPPGGSAATQSPLPATPVSAPDARQDPPQLPPFAEFFPTGKLPHAHTNIPFPASVNGCQPDRYAGSRMHEQHLNGASHSRPRPAQCQLAPSTIAAGIGRGGMMLVPHTTLCFVPVQVPSSTDHGLCTL